MIKSKETDNEEIVKIAKTINSLSIICDENPLYLARFMRNTLYDKDVCNKVVIEIKKYLNDDWGMK